MWSPKLLLVFFLIFLFFVLFFFFFLGWVTEVSIHTSVQREVCICHFFVYNSCHNWFFSVQANKPTSKQTCLSPMICGIFLGIYLSISWSGRNRGGRSCNPLTYNKGRHGRFLWSFFRVTCSRINIQHKLLNR
jgi:hypothetical protein